MKNNVVKVLGFSVRSTQFAVKTANFSFTVNDGRDLVRVNQIDSAELLLARLAGSIHYIGNLIGSTLNLDLKSIQVEVRGEVKNNEDDEKSIDITNFKKIDVIVKPTTPASIVLLKEWMDAVKSACPVFTDFKTLTPTVVTLVKEYDQINVA
ncbi:MULTISPECIES: OsmC family protein [Myroides]|uniref:Osmotically inducible protein OsmC n=1 Tax=Myroides albus TaxID=2562892 RepID=A0A6I3LQ04_9FLAO|nr:MULTISPECIES: OsmC family protein [Myroides]MTG98045.1 osmotically inducible protein OsmC [Myroides albus]MVX36317.1 osmotically inducible protein OsmC [Myroides sp. LoEW2-1]UVD80774.1 OsmC family protein [Myroides albus]